MKITIDASRYGHKEATGVEWYSYHIINGICKLLSAEDELILYSRDPINFGKKKYNITNKVLKAKRFWTLARLSREMKENPPDALFVPSHTLPFNSPANTVIMIHDLAFKHLKSAYSPIQYAYLNWSTKYAVKNAKKIITPSKATKVDLIKFFNCPEDKIEVIYHGFTPPVISEKEIDDVFQNSDIFKFFKITKSLKYLLFIGRLELKKNIIRVLKAFSDVSKNYPDLKIILAGKRGVGFNKILKELVKLDLGNKVILPGYITESEKAALFKYCRCFVFPSLYEGFGLPVLEAFYYEKPCVCSNFSSLPEVGGNACLYADPNNELDIAEQIEKVLNNNSLEQDLVQKGKERLKLFSWEEASKKTLNAIKNE